MKRLVFLAPFLVAMSCSSSVEKSISFPELPESNFKVAQEKVVASASVYVDLFQDERAIQDIVIGDAGIASAKGDVGETVTRAISAAFAKRGVNISDSATLIVSGSVKEWYAKVTSGVLGGISTEAVIVVQLADSSNQQLYTGLYSGSAEYSGGFRRKEFERAMVAAMEEAIAQAANDPKLITLLESF